LGNDELRELLLEEMKAMRTVDCHSHTDGSKAYYENGPYDLFSLMAYFNREIEALTGKAPDKPFESAPSDVDRWKALKGVLDLARNVSYWRHNMVVYRNLFDFKDEELNDQNWQPLNELIKRRTADPGWYGHVTKEMCRLETQVKNIPWFEDWEPEYFTAILRMEPALDLCNPNTRKSLEDYLGEKLVDLGVLRDCLKELVEKYRTKGAVGIKLAHAYQRTLASENVPYEVASNTYTRALRGEKVTQEEVRAFQDHIIFYLADLAEELGLVFQIHTGVQSTWGNIPNSNPLLLIPLITSHRSARFDLFHAGYPYSREIGILGKHYPNVWLNMAWMYVITMEGSHQSLSEWLDLVPGGRILGFGSDVHFPEMIYGHLLMARSCIADVMVEKVKRDFLSKEAALDLTHKLLRENALELYSLKRT